MDPADAPEPDEVGNARDVLSRWEVAGGVWRVVSRSHHRYTIALCSCEGREMARLSSTDAELIAFVRDRTTSED